jgi:phosphoglycolate phosphatase-like HAD superfamily hydrolase
MIGDTPDDMVAARLSRVLPIGVTAPEDDASKSMGALFESGAATVIAELSKIERMIK